MVTAYWIVQSATGKPDMTRLDLLSSSFLSSSSFVFEFRNSHKIDLTSTMQITADTIIRTASIYQGLTARAVNHEAYRYQRTFRGCFGVAPHLAAELWNMLDDEDPLSDIRWVSYFLATLMFLRTYTVTAVLAMIFMKDEKTIRHWVWVFIEKIASLDLVSHEQAFFFTFINRRLHQQRALTMYMLQSNTTPPDQMGVPTDE
ncbi:unknown protein [Seminavis robusta]|uniref:Uncharacterized protein n=1 Tax=Seminavis robusta TaxID=568900 RepID=A0A9N8F0X3_9STRA|nr:unknown protein [Seminavis robusta]|eukprot:Sro3064_g343050.1 n/a (202) ;mRNA; r:6960-7565